MRRAAVAMIVLAAAVVAIAVGIDWAREQPLTQTLWRQAVVPGDLSRSHGFLAGNCAACHAPFKEAGAGLCIGCHAASTALLQRQPTAFHAQVQICIGCHVEHRAGTRMPTTMDHALLAEIGERQSRATSAGPSAPESAMASTGLPQTNAVRPAVSSTRDQEGCGGATGCADEKVTSPPLSGSRLPAAPSRMGSDESMLTCASCHASKDRHSGFFGTDCVQCHATTQWTVSDFKHPSASSTDCAQCHKPPPSHNMMHFSMMSVPLARQPNAQVNQCHLCHQTTVWNDIKGRGMTKMH